MVAKTIDFVQTDKRFRDVEWDVDLASDVPELRGDVGQLQGVFINLFVNAADAMGELRDNGPAPISYPAGTTSGNVYLVLGDTTIALRIDAENDVMRSLVDDLDAVTTSDDDGQAALTGWRDDWQHVVDARERYAIDVRNLAIERPELEIGRAHV